MIEKLRICVVACLIGGISILIYLTNQDSHYFHVFYRGLFFLPVVLASFWYGLRGGLAASLSICVLYIPYALKVWAAFSVMDFDRIIDLTLYNLVALVMGILSDRDKANQKLAREAENLATVGRSLSAVAHDMKTPLIAIGGFTQLVKKHVHGDHPHRDKLDIIIDETQRLENMVKDMLDFSRPLQLDQSPENVAAVIEECLKVVAAEAQRMKIVVKCDCAQGLSAISIDRMRMKQALINLIMNAIQASPEGETVTVRSYQTRQKSVIEVIDCGCGIPVDQREGIFIPFFSTKKDGTGLGLPIVKKIVEAHRGQIQILDNPKHGTIFRIVLPIK
ncbi:MAG TPA: hypothetical protein DCP92_11805 [Nitrospiraceae bacterium]|jgi:signal transduction histidine kinase|nr:hypothetical protein [Nitrospiraceae bacterium]